VVVGLMVPRRTSALDPDPAEQLERQIAPWSACVVLPVFALANAGITFHTGMLAGPGAAAVFWGVALARVAGKRGGITLVCLAVVGLGLGRRPGGVRWRHLAGGAAVAGFVFIVPLLIAELAFVHQPYLVAAAEFGLSAGSVAAFAVGAAILLWSGAGGPTGSPDSEDDVHGGPEEQPLTWSRMQATGWA
jgi:NhaA family Na+:H+ antiporter